MQLLDDPIFHRKELTEYYLEYLKSPESSSGVFLAAPRRTGKTTFIKEDLVPRIRLEGATVIYADLWEDRSINPSIVIINAIRESILACDGAVLKAAKSAGLSRFKLAGFEMDLAKIGSKEGESISTTLQRLSAATQKPIIMVIDEAQHAQTTEEGRQTLFALKAARDALRGAGPGFRLIATGSNSDRLAVLVSAKDQAFFMAPMEELDQLGDDYLQWLLDNSQKAAKPSLAALKRVFEMCSRRPEPLKKVMRDLYKKGGMDVAELDARLELLMIDALQGLRNNFIQGLHGLEPLDAAVMRRMAQTGKAFTPFDTKALEHYKRLLQDYGPAEQPAPSQSAVQAALERLRKDGLVWNAGRGLWFIEDTQHVAWIQSAMAEEDALRQAAAGGNASQ
ncbi:ATP-binding protein [Polaromonas naphthalenivorans]|uniref:Uncharacterized protein n=1 Tax=Polaromonas naphthalenivorans (strain CJ2) TaxID=365044 RepID=A1VVK1_POLNA|nr:ATP-binding protein [Polaromonas naphthalenivorans]ABM39679.1 conserved hypothetical protein [Polaromonas naphthalenivorans CJ2]